MKLKSKQGSSKDGPLSKAAIISTVTLLSIVVIGGSVLVFYDRRLQYKKVAQQYLTTEQITAEGWSNDGNKVLFDANPDFQLWPVANQIGVEALLSEDGGNTWLPISGPAMTGGWQFLGLSFAPSNMLKGNEEPRFVVGYGKPTTEELNTFDVGSNGGATQVDKRLISTSSNGYLRSGQWVTGKSGPTYEGAMSGSG